MKDPARLKLRSGRAAWGVVAGLISLHAMAGPPELPAPKPEPMTDEALVAAFRAPARSEGPAPGDTAAQIALGRLLFFDARLSKSQKISCDTCHELATYGVDHTRVSTGHEGHQGRRNSPTVYNSAGAIAQFWDGRAPTLEVQAESPLFDADEMAQPDDRHLLATLTSMPQYVRRFREAFPGEPQPVTLVNVTRALAAFERQLTTRSRFDRFLGGEHAALSEPERRGLELFVSTGCTTCHGGPSVGGLSFAKLGSVVPYPEGPDLGRYEVTRDEADRMKFRVPPLLNVEKTAPYLHDGSVGDLGSAVRLMAKHQLGKTLTDAQVEELVAFLRSLTGELPRQYLSAPKLPRSTRKTPRPDPT